jgi:hypothetical protein
VAATTRNVLQGPGPLLVNYLSLKLTMLFRLLAAISGRSTGQPPGCCVFSPSEQPCVLTQASWFPLLRVPSSGTVSSSPNGAEPCLLLYPVGVRPSSSAAFPSSGRQWRPLLRLPNCRAIPLRRVSGTARHGIVSTLETQPRTTTTRRFGLAYAPHVDPLSSSLVVVHLSIYIKTLLKNITDNP